MVVGRESALIGQLALQNNRDDDDRLMMMTVFSVTL